MRSLSAFALPIALLLAANPALASDPSTPPQRPSAAGLSAAGGVLSLVVSIGTFAGAASALSQPDPAQHTTGAVLAAIGSASLVASFVLLIGITPYAAMHYASARDPRRPGPAWALTVTPPPAGNGAVAGVIVTF